MTQLIINGIVLPETKGNKYRCYPSQLTRQLDMISGRRVSELRGNVQIIEYSFDYLGDDLCRQLLAALRSGQPLDVSYLPDSGNEMQSGTFLVQTLTPPTFAFSRYGVGFWHNIAFTLREVNPHD